jgi:hypothetical protein
MIGMKSFKKKKFSDEAINFFGVAAILVGRSERGNNRYFILGLISVLPKYREYNLTNNQEYVRHSAKADLTSLVHTIFITGVNLVHLNIQF